MSKKTNLTNVANTYDNTGAINTNFERLNRQFENTLSLDGSTPNALKADLDMNSNDILNVKDINVKGDLTIDGETGLRSLVEEVREKHDDVEGWASEVEFWSGEVEAYHTDVQFWHQDVDQKFTEVSNLRDEVSADHSDVEGWTIEVKDIYEDIGSVFPSLDRLPIPLGSLGGDANNITASPFSGVYKTSFTTGDIVSLRGVGNNTGPVTLTIDTFGPFPVLDARQRELIGGELSASRPMLLRYSSANGGQWQFLDQVSWRDYQYTLTEIDELSFLTAENNYRQTLWSFFGDGPSGLSSPPSLVSEDGFVLETVGGFAEKVDIYKASLWSFFGDGPSNMVDPPLIVSEDEQVLASALSIGGGGGPDSNPLIRLVTDDGQSNGEAASYGSTSIVYGGGDPRMLTMVRGVENDPWLGMATGGGDSIELDGNTITGIGMMGPQISPSGRNGTTAGEAAVRSRLSLESGRFITLSNAEGGQGIGNLLPNPTDPTKFAFANIVTWMERAQALKGTNETLRYDLLLMQQGESNRTSSNLGERHEEYRAAVEAEAMRIFGQTERLRMITWQFSSTPEGGSTNAIQSLLDYAIAHDADQTIRHKVYFCGGTTYQFPWASDYLHNSSVGHAMRGETGAAIYRRILDEGFYLPLHAVSAEVTGANEITVTLSEAAEQATDLHVEAASDMGIELSGATISDVTVSGSEITITTSDAASGATEVGFGMQRHSDPRSNATIPRTNIRAVRPLGAYSPTLVAQTSDGLIRNWMCHQQIAI